jgi:hypothetical protein
MHAHASTLRLLVAAGSLLGAGCGSGKFTVQDPPTVAFNHFGQVTVTPFTVDGVDNLPLEKKQKALDVAAEISGMVRDQLDSRGIFPGGGRTLIISGCLIGFDPGSQALRYWVGFGAGSGEMVVDTTFSDSAGGTIARGNSRGSVSGGWFGGSTSSASKRVAKAIVGFIETNLERVE